MSTTKTVASATIQCLRQLETGSSLKPGESDAAFAPPEAPEGRFDSEATCSRNWVSLNIGPIWLRPSLEWRIQ